MTDPANRAKHGPPAAANLTASATPGREITILVDIAISGAGHFLANFHCSHNAGTDAICGGSGYSERSAATGTLSIRATLIGDRKATPGSADGSFQVIVSYQ